MTDIASWLWLWNLIFYFPLKPGLPSNRLRYCTAGCCSQTMKTVITVIGLTLSTVTAADSTLFHSMSLFSSAHTHTSARTRTHTHLVSSSAGTQAPGRYEPLPRYSLAKVRSCMLARPSKTFTHWRCTNCFTWLMSRVSNSNLMDRSRIWEAVGGVRGCRNNRDKS